MNPQIVCAFCGKSFDAPRSRAAPSAECPHCGKSSPGPAAAEPSPKLAVQRGAPNLSGLRHCPSCKAAVARDSEICVRCGLVFSSGQTIRPRGLRPSLPLRVAGAILALAAFSALAYFLAKAAPRTRQILPPPATPPAAATTPAPIPFETQKAQAADELRRQIDSQIPLSQPGDSVELRRAGGLVHKGTLLKIDPAASNPVAVLETSLGTVEIPLDSLDVPSRLRLDPSFRDSYVARRFGAEPQSP